MREPNKDDGYLDKIMALLSVNSAKNAKRERDEAARKQRVSEGVRSHMLDYEGALDTADMKLHPAPRLPKGYVRRSVYGHSKFGGEIGDTPDGRRWYFAYTGPHAGEPMEVGHGVGDSAADMEDMWRFANQAAAAQSSVPDQPKTPRR